MNELYFLGWCDSQLLFSSSNEYFSFLFIFYSLLPNTLIDTSSLTLSHFFSWFWVYLPFHNKEYSHIVYYFSSGVKARFCASPGCGKVTPGHLLMGGCFFKKKKMSPSRARTSQTLSSACVKTTSCLLNHESLTTCSNQFDSDKLLYKISLGSEIFWLATFKLRKMYRESAL